MAAYAIMWSSDIKSNVTNELPDPENIIIYNTWFYFAELEPIYKLGNVKLFNMAAVSGCVTTQQQIWRYQ